MTMTSAWPMILNELVATPKRGDRKPAKPDCDHNVPRSDRLTVESAEILLSGTRVQSGTRCQVPGTAENSESF